jgi:phosphoserine phosphatase
MSAEEKKLDELEARAAELRNTRNKLFEQIKKAREDRDTLNESARRMREEALKHREERDRINARVQEIKKSLGPLFEELDEKKGLLTEAEKALREEYRGRPDKSRVERDLNRTEWEIMTTPTREMLDREDEIIERASRLRRSLEEYKAVEKHEGKRMEYLAEKKATEVEIRALRDEIRKLSDQSQEHHEKMIVFHEQADAEKKKADEAHARYVQKIEEVNGVKEELNDIMPQAGALRDGLKVADLRVAERRRMSGEQRVEALRQEAIRKMESGEKLTFEDLRLIYGDDEDDDTEVLDRS